MKKFFYRALCAVALAVAWGCSDSDPVITPGNSTVFETADGKVSQFYLNNNIESPVDGDKTVTFTLINPSNQSQLEFSGTVKSVIDRLSDGSLECNMVLGSTTIPDGNYYILITVDEKPLGTQHYVMVSNNAVFPARKAVWAYSELPGEGTMENPYKISSSDDFQYFLNAITADPEHGYGQYFLLTADIDLPKATGDRLHLVFQGSLSGGGHTLNGLVYSGTKSLSDTNAGLFGTIFNATVSDVVIPDVSIDGVFSTAGAIAGEAKGSNSLSNIKLTGKIQSEREAGGLIGYSSGALSVSECDLDVTVNCSSLTGGIVGALVNSSGTSSRFTAVNIKGTVTGESNIGGLVGRVSGTSTVELSGVDNSMSVVARNYAGGFLGYVDGCYIKLTGDCAYNGKNNGEIDIKAENYAGTLAGYAALNHHSVNINDHYLNISSFVHANQSYAGGLMGYIGEATVNLSNLKMSPDCVVSAGADCAGGIIGMGRGAMLKGYYSVNDKHALPAAGSYHPIFSGKVTGRDCIGGIAGMMEMEAPAELQPMQGYINGFVSAATVTAWGEIEGGVVGKMNGDIVSCVFLGKLNTNSSSLAGGIAGKLEGCSETSYCINYSDIDGGKHQGGIAGYANPSKASGYEDPVWLTHCYNLGRLTGGCNVGGIVGYAGQKNGGCNFYLDFCENYGDILAAGSGSYSVGGIAGDVDNDYVDIHECYNYANISSRNVQFVIGGVVGKAGRDQIANNIINIHNCMNVGKVSCDKSSTKLGGVIGHLMHGGQAEIHGCVNWGDISCDQKDDTGGILGCATSGNLIVRNWNTGLISHGNGIVGTHAGASAFYHYGNYMLKGTGGKWPDAITVNLDDITSKKTFPDFPFGEYPDPASWPNFLGESFAMTSYGPVPYFFNFIHWDVERLTPPGWKKYPD